MENTKTNRPIIPATIIITLVLTVVIGVAFFALGILGKVAVIDGKPYSVVQIIESVSDGTYESFFFRENSNRYNMIIYSGKIFSIIMKICLIAIPICFTVYIISLVLFFTCRYNWFVITIFVFAIICLVGCAIMSIAELSFLVSDLKGYAINCTFASLASGGYLFACGIWGCIGYWILRALYYIFNIGYKGEAPMNYFQKILEVFIQILLLPMSVFFFCLAWNLLIGGPYFAGWIAQVFFKNHKGCPIQEGSFYYVGQSDKQVEKTVTHDIKDNYGHKIGSYETKEYETVHDDGKRYEMSKSESYACAWSLIALPCRIISIIFSVVALFVPKLYVKVNSPEKGERYNDMVHHFLDLIVFK